VRLLLDTHAFLWHADGSPQMSASATALLVDPANELFLSTATVWEIAIKVGLKKLSLSAPYITFMTRAINGYGLTVLPITFDDCAAYEQLPFPDKQHRDPF
jgi:PIN domain nuclease of toxin-antitoxin system